MNIMKVKSREELEALREEYRKALNSQDKQILVCAGTGCMADENGNSISRKEAEKVLENYFLNSENRDFNDDVEVVFKFKLFEIF